MNVFSCTSVVWPYIVFAEAARNATLSLLMIGNLTGSQDIVRVCVGKHAVALLAKG